jgi:hypothetical protein
MKTKICLDCKEAKSLEEFPPRKNRKSGVFPYCRICTYKRIKLYREKYPDRWRATRKKYQQSDKGKKATKKYYQTHAPAIIAQKHVYNDQNREHINARQRDYNGREAAAIRVRHRLAQAIRRANNPMLKVRGALGARLNYLLKLVGGVKVDRIYKLIGCTPAFLRAHIEANWTEGMNWGNYGLGVGKWHVDHIIACQSGEFDLLKKEDQYRCFNWINLQPMWGVENIRKGKSLATRT